MNFLFTSPYKFYSNKIVILGGGELGKQLIISAQNLGIETHVISRYEKSPASQVSHYSYVLDMMNGNELKNCIFSINPDYIIPEIEAINITALKELEDLGFNVVPNTKSIKTTMDREKIRLLASKKKILTSKYVFAETYEEFLNGIKIIKTPCVIKPTMSSSGKGQTILKNNDIELIKNAWDVAHNECRGSCEKVIIEEYIDFDFEITLMTFRYKKFDNKGNSFDDIEFCPTIGHYQKKGDYACSWQPQYVKELKTCKNISKIIVNELGGYGIFGVEFFIKDNKVFFSELSPRPHDTAFLTLKTQNISIFDIHMRSLLNLPIPEIKLINSGVSKPIIIKNNEIHNNSTDKINIKKIDIIGNTYLYIFGKPCASKRRRMGIIVKTLNNNSFLDFLICQKIYKNNK